MAIKLLDDHDHLVVINPTVFLDRRLSTSTRGVIAALMACGVDFVHDDQAMERLGFGQVDWQQAKRELVEHGYAKQEGEITILGGYVAWPTRPRPAGAAAQGIPTPTPELGAA